MPILIFIEIFIFSFSNSIQETYNLKVDYSMDLSFSSNLQYNASLLCNNKEAYFEWQLNSNDADDNLNSTLDNGYEKKIKIEKIDTTTFFVHSDLSSGLIFERKPRLNESYIVTDEMKLVKWEIKDSVKVIGDIHCNYGTVQYRGRTYHAWYNPEVPVNFGPWKLHGLPGLIIELYDDLNEIYIIANRIKPSNEVVKKVNINEAISQDQWATKKDEFLTSFRNRIIRTLPRTATLSDFNIEENRGFEIEN